MKNIYMGLLLVFLTSNLTAQNNEKDTLQHLCKSLLGHWEGKGTLMGNPATFRMQWSTSLNNQFIQLKFSNSFTDKQGIMRTLESRAYYNFNTRQGVWVDSRGVILPLKLEFTSNTLTVLWGNTQTEQGKTIYKVEKSTIKVEDHVLNKGNYFLFGTASYNKK